MLHYIAEKSTDLLINHKIVNSTEKNIYVYGFELIWSFILYFIFSSVIYSICDCYNYYIVFLVFFVPIRITGGGYHSKTYARCFVLSNLVTFITLIGAYTLFEYGNVRLLGILKILLIFLVIYIWNNVPVVYKGYTSTDRYTTRNRKCSHIIVVIYSILIILMELFEYVHLEYTAIMTLLMVALLIFITKTKEKTK